jgi:hypothetical protein
VAAKLREGACEGVARKAYGVPAGKPSGQDDSRFYTRRCSRLGHNLHLALLQFATVDYLEFNIESLESDYRQAVGPTAYNAYLAAIALKKRPDPEHAEYESFLRTESTYLASETRRQQLLKQHAEATRQRLLEAAFRSWWRNIIPLVAVLLAFLISLSWVQAVENAQKEQAAPRDSGTVKFARPYLVFDGQPPDFARAHYKALFKAIMIAALLALAGIAGATGGMMSVIQRMHASTPESDPATDLWALSQAETAVFFAPVEGLIFAIVLSLCFAGGVLKGTIFPELTGPRESEWFLTLFNGKNLAIWLLWAFIAGFLERLVPNTLDSLA